MFHFIIFNSVYVSECPPLGKEQLTRVTISVLFVLCLFVILAIFRFGFEDGFRALNAPASGHYLLLTFIAIMFLFCFDSCLTSR